MTLKVWKFYYAIFCPLCKSEVVEVDCDAKTGAGEHFIKQHGAKILRINRAYDSKGKLLYDKTKQKVS